MSKFTILSMFVLLFFSVVPAREGEAARDSLPKVKTTVSPLDLSRNPALTELMEAGQLGGPLHPTHELEDAVLAGKVNHSFGTAMERWNRHEYREAAELLKQHISEYSQSPWTAEALLHLGCDAQYNGRYLEARQYFEKILIQTQGQNYPGAKAITDKAKLRMGVLKTFQNNLTEARTIFGDLQKNAYDWRQRTYAGHWLQRISRIRKNRQALNCGTQALAAMLERDGRRDLAGTVMKDARASARGQSIEDLERNAASNGYPLVARSVEPDRVSELPVPSIVHLPADKEGDSGHYWLLDGVDGKMLTFFDPQAGKYFVQSASDFARQWNGMALVKNGVGLGKSVGKELAGETFGGCCGVPRPEEDLGCPDGKCKQGPSMGGGNPAGAPVWSVNMVNMNFYMTDMPLWYRSPVGPPVEIRLSYNSQSAIAQHEPFGNKWQFNYSSYLVVDTGGEVTIFMPDGRRDVYRPNNPINPAAGYQKPYRVFNVLTYLGPNQYSLQLPDGTTYRYAIPPGTDSLQPFLTEIADTHGQKLTFGYNQNVQMNSITDAAGKITSLTYTNGLITRVTDPIGRHADFSYDGSSNLAGITDMGGYATTFSYDANVYLTGITNGGGAWNIYIEPADGIDNGTVRYPDPGGGMWENYRITVTNPAGGREEYYYDGYSGLGWYKSPRHYGSTVRTLEYGYAYTGTNRGEIGSVTSPEGVSMNFGYDLNGMLTSQTDGHNHLTSLSYNALGNILSYILPNLQETTLSYAPNGSDITSIENSLGTVTLGYNTARDLISVRDRMGATTLLAYNGFGQPTTITDSLGVSTTYTYDQNHFLTQIGRGGMALQSYTYDQAGRVRTYTNNTTGITVTYDYNGLDDLVRVTWPDTKYIAISYSNSFPHLVTGVTDRAGRATSLTYDSLKRLTQVVNPEGGTTRFSYDPDGNPTTLFTSNGRAVRFYYDNDGRLKTRVEPDGSRTAFTYDPAGLLAAVTNGRGMTSSRTYDSSHNLMQVVHLDGTPSVVYQYDSYGRMTRMDDGTGTHLYTYDANSRLLTVDGPLASDTISYAYDSEGRRTGVAVQGGLSTTRGFDSLDRLTSLANATGTYSYSYSGASPLPATLTRPNGAVTSYGYDSLARLISIVNTKSNATTLLSSYGYTYNAQDQRATETALGFISPSITAYSRTGFAYDAANKLLSATTPLTFTHDLDGNLTSGTTPDGYRFTAEYDAENRLKAVEYNDGAVTRRTEYRYNGLGFMESMVRKINGAIDEQINYVRDRSIVYQERSSLRPNQDYTWGLGYGGGVGGLLGLKIGTSAYSYLYDGRGNITGVIDGSQDKVAAYEYDPFGRIRQESGTLEQPFLFSTKPYDRLTGLSYFGYRHYLPAMGRWMTRDPLGEAGGTNLYRFVGNDPVNRFDPFGLEDDIWQKMAKAQAEHAAKAAAEELANQNKWTKMLKDGYNKIKKGFEVAEDVREAKEACTDSDPRSGVKLLEKMKYLFDKIPMGNYFEFATTTVPAEAVKQTDNYFDRMNERTNEAARGERQ